jgi:hypothetical protein
MSFKFLDLNNNEKKTTLIDQLGGRLVAVYINKRVLA